MMMPPEELSDSHCHEASSDHTFETAFTDSAYSPDIYAGDPRYQELSSELRALLFAGAQTAYPSRAQSPKDPAVPGGSNVDQSFTNGLVRDSSMEISEHCQSAHLARYYRTWVTECAPWLDMFDQARTFGLKVPMMARESPAVLYALLALAARQLERHRAVQDASYKSIEFYSQAIVSLSAALDSIDSNILVTACILCVLEMMSASPRDWRRHLEGCASLFEASAVHGLSGGVQKAVFWCFARMDLCGAIISDGTASTVLPISRWVLLLDEQQYQTAPALDKAIFDAFIKQSQLDADMHANLMVYLCAKVCHLIALRTHHIEMGQPNTCSDPDYGVAWSCLYSQLQEWYNKRPSHMYPIKTGKVCKGFPGALYAHYAAISGTQLYHTACVLLLDSQPPELLDQIGESYSSLFHARHIVGISLANGHKGCLNNAIQPLYVAGRRFTHAEEHLVVVQLLNAIEAVSGWAARWRIRDLEVAWGYSPGTFSSRNQPPA